MSIAANVKTETGVATGGVARIGDRVVRVFGSLPCPHCLRGRLHANAVRELGKYQYALTCQRCHADIVTITTD
jgi:hypothetical protein